MVQLMPLSPHHPHLFNLSGAGIPRFSWNEALKWVSACLCGSGKSERSISCVFEVHVNVMIQDNNLEHVSKSVK